MAADNRVVDLECLRRTPDTAQPAYRFKGTEHCELGLVLASLNHGRGRRRVKFFVVHTRRGVLA